MAFRRCPRLFTALAAALLLACAHAPSPALAAGRVALVIGNAAYPTAPLKNPVNDATDMAAALGKLGFEVTLLQDASMQRMEEAVRAFGLKLRGGGMGLFYFAGHGVQVAGENYLVPVNAVIQSEGDVKYGCLNAGLVLAKMEDAGNGPNVVILDACRNNPFARSFRSAEAGLARMDAPTGSLIAYATAPGKVAADGEGRNGLYTQHLLRNIATPGLSITDLFMGVREGVVRDSGKKQVPWENTSLIGRFSLAGQAAASAPAAPAAPEPKPAAVKPAAPVMVRAPEPSAKEKELLDVIRQVNVPLEEELGKALAAKGSIYGKYALERLSEDKIAARRGVVLAANQGIALAMVDQAKFLAYSALSDEDRVEARNWLDKAIALGEPAASFELGVMLIEGRLGPADLAAGERCFAAAAKALPSYYTEIGCYFLLMDGKYMPVATAKAKGLAYLRRGAALGETDAMMRLGSAYKLGTDAPKDMPAAMSWFMEAALKGNPEGMKELAFAYWSGQEGVRKDMAETVRWFQRAVDKGDIMSMLTLGELLRDGNGVKQDLPRAVALFRRGAELDSRLNQKALAELYEKGLGVPKSIQQAYFWQAVAARESTNKDELKRLAGQLAPAERDKIEAQAAKWKPKAAKQ